MLPPRQEQGEPRAPLDPANDPSAAPAADAYVDAVEDAPDGPAVDPTALEAAAAGWDNRLHAAALGLLVLAASTYPLLFRVAASALGVRRLAATLAVASLVPAAFALRGRGRAGAARVFAGGLVAGLAAVAAWSGDPTPLRFLPALVHAGVAVVFFTSLRDDVSLVERGARLIQPVAPDFIGPYCRLVTALWGVVMATNAVAVAWAATTPEHWQMVAGRGVWAWMGAVSVVEFLVRKTYFRNYYYGGPFERLWSRLFPAENTEMGRRSAAYIRVVRQKLQEREKGGA